MKKHKIHYFAPSIPEREVQAANGDLLLQDEVRERVVDKDPEHLAIPETHKHGLLPHWATHNSDVANLRIQRPISAI